MLTSLEILINGYRYYIKLQLNGYWLHITSKGNIDKS